VLIAVCPARSELLLAVSRMVIPVTDCWYSVAVMVCVLSVFFGESTNPRVDHLTHTKVKRNHGWLVLVRGKHAGERVGRCVSWRYTPRWPAENAMSAGLYVYVVGLRSHTYWIRRSVRCRYARLVLRLPARLDP